MVRLSQSSVLRGLLSNSRCPGPIVRIGPNAVSINTVSALEEIYGNRKANVKKSGWYESIAASAGGPSTHSEVNREQHAFRRRVLGHAFSDSAIRSAEAFILENIRNWCKHLAEGAKHGEWAREKDMNDWCTYLAYDIMGDLVFGKRFNVMENDEHRFVPATSMGSVRFVYSVPNILSVSIPFTKRKAYHFRPLTYILD